MLSVRFDYQKQRLAETVFMRWNLTQKQALAGLEEPEISCRVVEEKDLDPFFRRDPAGHKGTFGKVLIAAGSPTMCGAAFFSAAAALRTGCGMVKIQTAEENRLPLLSLLPEAMLESPDVRKTDMDWCDVLVAGPGFGTDAAACDRLLWLLRQARERNLPLVLDADGLNILSAHPQWQKELPQQTILTPHVGEMSRLTGKTVQELVRRRIPEALELAEKLSSVCVLKDACTIIAGPEGQLFVNTTGNNGMGTAGSGDVLAGMTGAFLALGRNLSHKPELTQLAACAVYLHGKCGDQAAAKVGAHYMLARDIIEELKHL